MSEPRTLARIAVYCGSSNRVEPRFFDVGRLVGRTLAEQSIEVVYGGGSVGLMGAVADAALESGGRVSGVITEKLQNMELAHPGLTELFVTETMAERKIKMASLADGFVALPGGWGTLEELFEVVTLTQLEYHRKPVGLLNAHGYYDHLIAFFDHATEEGFVRPGHRGLIADCPNITDLLEQLRSMPLPGIDGLF